MTVLKSHYHEAWFVVFSWFLQLYVYSRQNINKQIEFFFHRMGSMRNKMHQTFSAGALPPTPLGSHDPIVGGGIPLGSDKGTPFFTPSIDAHGVSTWAPPATHFHFNHFGKYACI